MKALVVALLLFLPLLAQAQADEVPASIQEFIEARNYAAAFSTPAERAELATFNSRDEVLEHTNSERLANVFARLLLLSERTLELDPGMVVQWGSPPGGAFGALVEALVPSAIVAIEQTYEPAPNRLVVQVKAHRFLRDTNLELINDYTPDGSVPELSPGDILASGAQIMTWIQVGDTWMKRTGVVETLNN